MWLRDNAWQQRNTPTLHMSELIRMAILMSSIPSYFLSSL